MSRETMKWLRGGAILYGLAADRGGSWYDAHRDATDDNGESISYDGFIPVEDIRRRLLGWSVERSPVFVQHNGEIVPAENRVAMVASDNGDVLGIFKDSSYADHQYEETMIRATADIVDTSSGDLGVSSVGFLKNRAVMWLQIEMPDSITTREGVEYRPRLIATTSFDGSSASRWKLVNGIVVCDNTRDAALAEDGASYAVKHSKNSKVRIADAKIALGILHTMSEKFEAEVAALTSVKVSDKQFDAILDRLVPMPEDADKQKAATTLAEKKRDDILRLYRADERAASWHGTGWGVAQAFNTWLLHESRVNKGASRDSRNMDAVLAGRVAAHDAEVLEALYAVTA